jgi:hypothetical protein
MSYYLPETTCIIAKDGTTSAAADLGSKADWVAIAIPTIDSATLALQVSDDNSTFTALGSSLSIPASTGAFVDIWMVGGHRYIKIVAGSAQTTAAVTFTVQGIRI